MTSGARTAEPGPARRRALHALASLSALAALGVPSAGRTAKLELQALMALLAQRKSGEARFTEERFVSGFDSPLRSSGTLSFVAPDRFARHTLEPRPESMAVTGNELTLVRAGRTRRLALDAMPELAALLEAMRGTLAGDADLLRKHFELRVDGTPALWTLELKPLDPQLANQVRSVSIAGQGSDLRSVELWLAGGDRSLMLIEPRPGASAVRAAPR